MLLDFMMMNDLGPEFHFVASGSETEKKYEGISNVFRAACEEVIDYLNGLEYDANEEEIQFEMYEIGKRHYGQEPKDLKVWFKHLYQLMFRENQGPRWGTFIFAFGRENFVSRLNSRLENPFSLWVFE